MAAFVYRAVDAAGRSQRGVIEAGSPAGARQLLRERSLLPLSIEAGRATERIAGEPFRLAGLFRRKIGARALATTTRQLSTLIGSSVHVEEALRLVAAQADSTQLGSLLLDLRSAILDGQSLASALARHPATFPEYFRASIAAGERSGRLGEVLEHLADNVEARHRAVQKIRLALLYPALLAGVSLGMMTLLMIYVVPDIVRVFVSRGADLPFLTRALIALSAYIAHWGLPTLAVLGVAGYFGARWAAEPANRLRIDRALAQRPPFARFSRQVSAARFAGTLATLVQSAVPLVDALTAAAAVTPNAFVRARTVEIAERVREGGTLNRAMAEADVFPPMLVAIVASGESSGRLGTSLSRAAQELDREMDALVAAIVALVEPAVLLLMGGLVLLMVLAILLPIINLNNLVAS